MERESQRIVPVSIAMPFRLAQRLRVLAALENKSRSQFVRETLERALPPTDTNDQNQSDSGEG